MAYTNLLNISGYIMDNYFCGNMSGILSVEYYEENLILFNELFFTQLIMETL